MINIPMNTKPPVSLSALANAGNTQTTGAMNQAPMQNTMPMGNAQMPGAINQAPMQNAMPMGNVQQPIASNNGTVPRPAATGVILQKGQKTSLAKFGASLENLDVGLGWDVADRGVYDLDAECFILGANDKVIGDDWFVYYNQPSSPDGAVRHSGDNRTGEGTGDDEVINIRLSQLNQQAQKLVFVVTINEAKERNLNFSGVQNAYIRLVDKANNRELCRFNLTEYYSNVTSMVVAEIYRHNGEWKMNPVGDGMPADLYDLCVRYGVNVAG